MEYIQTNNNIKSKYMKITSIQPGWLLAQTLYVVEREGLANKASYLKDKGGYRELPGRSANANLESRKVLGALQMLSDAAHAIMTPMTASCTQPDFASRKVQIIMDDQDLV